MNAKTVELILSLVQTAGPRLAAGTVAGAKWIKRRDEVQAMIDEGRDPTPEEHRELTRELVGLNDALGSAIETAIGADTATDAATDPDDG